MKQYKEIPQLILAEQFFKNKELSYVTKHEGCGYRMCPICGGDDTDQIHYVVKSVKPEYSYLKETDWIIKDNQEGYYYVVSDESFKKLYEEDKINVKSLDSKQIIIDVIMHENGNVTHGFVTDFDPLATIGLLQVSAYRMTEKFSEEEPSK